MIARPCYGSLSLNMVVSVFILVEAWGINIHAIAWECPKSLLHEAKLKNNHSHIYFLIMLVPCQLCLTDNNDKFC